MKALVTGGAGFIGSHIVEALLAEGHEVSVVDNLHGGRRENLPSDVVLHLLDIGDDRLIQVMRAERPEVVYHQAAQMSVKVSTDDPIFDARVNVIGLLNVLDACARSGVRKVVFASSGATYGNPSYLPLDEAHPQRPEAPYGITKMVAEHYLAYYARDHGLAFTALRYGNVYGPRQDSTGEAGVVAIFIDQLLRGRTPTIHWDGEQTRDYVFVTDVAQANVRAATRGDGLCVCVGTGVGTTVNEIYRRVLDAMGLDLEPRRSARRPGDLRAAYFDAELAARTLGWSPTVSLADGIRSTVAFFRGRLDGDGRSGPEVDRSS